MTPDVVLKFDGGFLKPLKVGDVHEGYTKGLNDPEVNHFLDAVKEQVQTQQSVCEFVHGDESSTNNVLWGVWANDSKNHVGTVRLHGIEHRHKTALIGACMFDKAYWGKGIGSKSINRVAEWGIDILQLRWIEAGIFSSNVASVKAFEKAGFRYEYTIKKKYLHNNTPADVVIYVHHG